VIDYVGDLLRHRGKRQGRVLVVSWIMNGACANLRKHRVVCGFSWLLRVIDHEKQSRWTQSFVLKLGSQVIGVVETWVWTADKQPVALLAKK
jgi:hypothetical protein